MADSARPSHSMKPPSRPRYHTYAHLPDGEVRLEDQVGGVAGVVGERQGKLIGLEILRYVRGGLPDVVESKGKIRNDVREILCEAGVNTGGTE